MKKIGSAVAIVVLVLVLGATLWMFIHHSQSGGQAASEAIGNTMRSSTTAADSLQGIGTSSGREIPYDYQEYRSTPYHFSLLYPLELSVREYNEGGDAATITFQSTSTAEGFQLFIIPYGASAISADRFRKDEPSGVRGSPQNISVGGVPAVSFYGYDTRLGDTAEVWFIRDGYLYEATAPKSEAAWLSTVLAAWKFI